MPASASASKILLYLLIIICFSVAAGEDMMSRINRRILHQPFFPLDSSSPPAPPSPSQHSFFPSFPASSSSTPTTTVTPSAPPFSTSFPANISSLILPHSPSSSPVSKKLVAVTVALSLSAALIAAVALFLYFRSRRYHRNIVSRFNDKSSSKSVAAIVPTQVPKLRNPGPNSAEFLYLGTLANSTSIDEARGSSAPRKLGSPELQPLPPLIGRQHQQNGGGEQDHEQFYSPRGSVSGRESGSQSTRVFSAENLVNNGGNSRNSMTSSSSSSASNSPARSASISISPPISNSPNNRMWSTPNPNPKSTAVAAALSPQLTEVQIQSHARTPPASPPLPAMTFSPPYSPSSATSSSGNEIDMSPIKEEDEAEESPLLSNSSSSAMTSPPQSPRLSPLAGKIGKSSPDEREWNVLSRDSPSSGSMSNGSTPSRKSTFSSLKLPVFLGGGKRKSSAESTSVTNSPVSSPISSVGSSSRHSRSYPASPLSSASDRRKSLPVSSSSVVPAPPPPPPPPALRRSQSPPPPPPTSEPAGIEKTPLASVVVEKPKAVAESLAEVEETTPKPKLKPLHWDKVRASSDKEMAWDHFRSSSFKLNEEMIETLFIVNTPNPSQKEMSRNPIQPWPKQENRVLDPKKAQNIAILLRALHVTMEEVCEALMEGNAQTLGAELLESLLKMAPTKEEERKLMAYKDDSPVKLGHAEKFLKAVIDIPFAFKRIEAMLYAANFESEVEYLKKSFETLEVACDELRSSRMFLKLLEAVLKTGNRMNVGTNRGDAQAFKLDTLLKLVDIKGADGKTTLLHFVVQEIIRTEGQRLSVSNNQPSNDEPKCRKLGLQVVSSLSSELSNVKKSAAMDSDVLSSDVTKLTSGLGNIEEVVRLIEQAQLQETDRRFSESMNKFVKTAEEDIFRVQAQERVALSLVKEITEYFHGNSAKEEAHPFRIFMVVRDFLTVLDRVCKEVGMINERTIVSSAHRFPIPVNPMLPVPVNPFHSQALHGFPGQIRSSFSDNGSP